MLTCVVGERPRHQSMFTNRWKRSEELEEDEWFIPYKRRSAPQAQLHIPQGGIGEMPNTSTSVNMARPTRSFFGSGSGSHGGSGSGSGLGQGSGSSHRRQKSNPVEDDPTTRSRFFKRPAFPRSGSDGSLTRPAPLAIPSTTSVPTGLTAPKMLFSPLMREIRDDSQPTQRERETRHPPSSHHIPRQRTVSLPKNHTPSHVYDKVDQHRWAATTMCDMLVFPRPHITPHTITPPASPEKLPSMFDGLSVADRVDRDKERNEWHKFVEKRARGRSFRIGNNVKGDQEGGHGIFNRARSASAGAGPSRKPSRKSDKSKYQDPNSAPPITTSFDLGKRATSSRDTQHHVDLDNDPFRHRPTEAERYKTAHHQHTKSSPDLSASHQHRNRVRVAPRPPWQDDGVIVIGPSKSRSGLSTSSTKPDFTKPLPPLPAEYRLQYNPSSPFKPFGPKDDSRSPSPALLPPSKLQSSDPPSVAPADPSRPNNELSAADARAMIAKQHQRALTKRAFNSPRPRQHRESEVSVSTASQYSTASQRASTLSAVSPLRRMTAMEEAITRSRANSAGSQTPTAMRSSTASRASAATTVTATPLLRSQMREPDRSTQTTPRMRQVSAESQTPSPRNQNHEDFKVRSLLSV